MDSAAPAHISDPHNLTTAATAAPSIPSPTSEHRRGRKPRNPEQRAKDARRARLRRAVAKVTDEKELQELEQRLQGLQGRASKPAPTPIAPPELKAIQGGAGSAATPAPAVARPGWPSDEAIAEATGLAEMIVGAAGVLLAGTKYEKCVSGETLTMIKGAKGAELVKVDKAAELVKLTAPLIAKYVTDTSAPMEVQCGLGIAMLVLPPIAQEYLLARQAKNAEAEPPKAAVA